MSTDTDSETPAEEVGGKAALIEALAVPRNARRGFGFGILFTVATFVFFVVIPGTNRSQLYYLALAFVLAIGIGGLATAILTIRQAFRLSKEL